MKTKLKLCALITFVLAAAPRLEAATFFVDVHDSGGPGDLASIIGAVAVDPQGNVWGAAQTGDTMNVMGGFFKIAPAPSSPGDYGSYYSSWYDSYYSYYYTYYYYWYSYFGGPGGSYPSTGVTMIGHNLYAATYADGAYGNGTFFHVNTDGAGFQASSFPIAFGTYPTGNLTAGPDGNLYGVCAQGGNGHGTVVEINAQPFSLGNNGLPLLAFNGTTGDTPSGNLCWAPVIVAPMANARADGVKANANTSTFTLYGVTFFGGTNGSGPGTGGYGTVYKINNDGSGFQTLHVFSSQRATNGYGPAGGLALSGNTLYGTTSGGGQNTSGTIFKIDTSGSNFMVLKSFSAYGIDSANNLTNTDGEAPEGGLFLSGDTLYGTTLGGGTNGGGVVFSVNTNGGNFTVLHSFSTPTDNGSFVYTNSGGGGTRAGVVLAGHILFGTTPYGGKYGGGTVFAIILPSPPALNIAPAGGNFAVSWPSSATNFMLQQNLTLNSLTWSNFNGAVNDNGTNKSVSIIPAAGNAFFRLLNTNGP